MDDDYWRWGTLMVACVDALRLEQSDAECAFVDREIIPPFTGHPDEISVWFICSTKKLKERFQVSVMQHQVEALKKKMIEAGFPESAVQSIVTRVTSLEEIEDGGGRFAFFR